MLLHVFIVFAFMVGGSIGIGNAFADPIRSSNESRAPSVLDSAVPIIDTRDWHSTYFLFFFGRWMEAWPHDPGDCTISTHAGVPQLFRLEKWKFIGEDVYAPEDYDCIRSPHFASKYYLVYAKTPFSWLGQGGPELVFIAEKSDSLVLVQDLECENWSQCRSRSLRYVEEDFAGIKDSTEAWEAAIDAISIVAGNYPLIFVDSLEDICAYSSLISDSLHWPEIQGNPVAWQWLMDYRIVHLDSLFSNLGRSREPTMDCLKEVEKFRAEVRARRMVFNGGSWKIETATWSPSGGSLTIWKVRLGPSNLSIKVRDVSDLVGYYFIRI